MKSISLDNKTFMLLSNSENGRVTSETQFHYQQQGDLVTAKYAGGSIVTGRIIGILTDDILDIRYHCVTDNGELKAGRAKATVSLDRESRIRLRLKWQWIDVNHSENEVSGESEYVEIPRVRS